MSSTIAWRNEHLPPKLSVRALLAKTALEQIVLGHIYAQPSCIVWLRPAGGESFSFLSRGEKWVSSASEFGAEFGKLECRVGRRRAYWKLRGEYCKLTEYQCS